MFRHREFGWHLGVGLLAALTGGCGSPATSPPEAPPTVSPWFADVTDAVGLDFVHDAGPTGSHFMPQAIGSGAAIFDANGDGRLDLYLLQNGGPDSDSRNRLYRQRDDGTFEDASAGSGLNVAGHNMGVAVGDVDNDGLPDVVVTQYAGARLFLNTGGGRFRDATAEGGLHNPSWGASAAFLDYDRDGRLDLAVVNYVDYDPTWPCTSESGVPDYCAPRTFRGSVTRLFRNLGRGGGAAARFEDVTLPSGLGRHPGPGLGVVCHDFDGDGWADVFVANDGAPNHLWVNRRDGTFAEEAVRRGVACNAMGRAEAGMGVALADGDGDGLMDLFVTHLTAETNTLWLQGPRGFFRDRTVVSGLASPRWRGTGFGTVFGDFDHDGRPDLAVANGRVAKAGRAANPDLGPHWGAYAERNQVFANEGGARFRDLSPSNPALCGTPNVARGLACADLDGDGALDLLVTAVAGRARLLRNVAPDRGRWLMVRALDPALKRDAYGAVVRVSAGGARRVGLVNPGHSYLCNSDVRAHFGLGPSAGFDAIEVTWPDGMTESFPGGAADRVVVLSRGAGSKKEAP
jgi:hypothetical protein